MNWVESEIVLPEAEFLKDKISVMNLDNLPKFLQNCQNPTQHQLNITQVEVIHNYQS